MKEDSEWVFRSIFLGGPYHFRFLRPYARFQRRKEASTRYRATVRVVQLPGGLQFFFLSGARRVVRGEVLGRSYRFLIRHFLSSHDDDCYFNDDDFVNGGRSTYPRLSSSRMASCSGRSIYRFVKICLSRGELTHHSKELSVVVNARVFTDNSRRVNVTCIPYVVVLLLVHFGVDFCLVRDARERNSDGGLTPLFYVGAFKEFNGNFMDVFDDRITGVQICARVSVCHLRVLDSRAVSRVHSK